MPRAVILSAVRTPVGRYGGALAEVRPDDLAATAIAAAVERAGVPPREIEDVWLGCANQAGEDNRNVARMAALLAGLPDSVAGVTVNRLCASGLAAVVGRRARGDRRRRRPVRRGRGRVDEPRAARDGEAGEGVPARQPDRLGHDARLALPEPEDGGDVPARVDGRDRARTSPSAGASRARTRTRSRWSRRDAGRRRTPRGGSTTSSSPSASVTRDEHPRPDTTPRSLPR